jgi:hypothetical protein
LVFFFVFFLLFCFFFFFFFFFSPGWQVGLIILNWRKTEKNKKWPNSILFGIFCQE